MADRPAWLDGLTHRDWLIDGGPIDAKTYDALDWAKARLDMGPSPAGNLGPYWHVPLPGRDTVHRLYPKWDKWLGVMRQAVEEAERGGG